MRRIPEGMTVYVARSGGSLELTVHSSVRAREAHGNPTAGEGFSHLPVECFNLDVLGICPECWPIEIEDEQLVCIHADDRKAHKDGAHALGTTLDYYVLPWTFVKGNVEPCSECFG